MKEEAKKAEEAQKDSMVNAITEMTDSLQSAEGFMTPGANMSGVNADKWWANVEAEMRVFEDAPDQQGRSLWYIFLAGFLGGLIALVTPCVWPMIPMTVSFFLKGNKSRSKAVSSAIIYGASIVVIYVALGLIVTAIFGASALNELATSAGFNVAFFLLLVVFAISFMGGFEITLPAKWTNKMDSKVDIFRSSSWRSRLCSYPSPAPARSSVRSSWKQPQQATSYRLRSECSASLSRLPSPSHCSRFSRQCSSRCLRAEAG